MHGVSDDSDYLAYILRVACVCVAVCYLVGPVSGYYIQLLDTGLDRNDNLLDKLLYLYGY